MNTDDASLSTELARWAVALRYEDLPQAAVHHVRRSLLDFLGVTLGGAVSGLGRSIQRFVEATEPSGPALVIGTNLMTSPAGATLANGTAAAALELDDGHARAPIHPGASTIPAILAVAQQRELPLRDVVLAIAVGTEISSRLGIAVGNTSADKGFHSAPIAGVMGATAGVSKLLGNDVVATSNALGLAGSNAGGLFDYHGGWLNAWCVNTGRAGREGLLCATLPGFGIAGPHDIFDGPKGYGAAFAGSVGKVGDALASLGQEWLMLETAVKAYPCCRRLHPVIDAIVKLREEAGTGAEAVDRIVVETSAPSARLDRKTFEDVSAAQMSIPYGAAAAYLFGELQLEHFEDAARGDARLIGLAQRVDVRESSDSQIGDPMRFAARVSLSVGGRTLGLDVTAPKGDPENPVDDDALESKFHGLAAPVVGQASARSLAAQVWTLGQSPADETVLKLLKECRPA